jgi:Uma2 family endonuclease
MPARALPTHLDLPDTDGKPAETTFQSVQSRLLTGCLRPVFDQLHPDYNYFVGADSGIYWRLDTDDPLQGCKSPDWYYVPNVPPMLDGTYRRSYVLWQENVRPLLVIEYVSGNGSEERDATPGTGKFWVYEQMIQAWYYAIHDPDRERLEVFELVGGRYRALEATTEGRYLIEPIGLELGVWQGEYQDISAAWLRAWDRDGKMIASLEEKADKLAARLRELGVDPESV